MTLAALYLAAATQGAGAPVGEWVVADRSARVVIQSCGDAKLCGHLSWTSDGKEVGREILIDMRPDGARWTGTVVDVRNGLHYLAHIALQSQQRLRLDGCVIGGLICAGEVWTRY